MKRLILALDAWLTTYIRKTIPAAHHIGQSTSPDILEFPCCRCSCPDGCDVVHRDPCDRHQEATS